MSIDRLVYQAARGSSIVECAVPDDAKRLANLDGRCFRVAWPVDHYRAEVDAPRRIVRVIRSEHRDQIVALINARGVLDELEVIRIAVDPRYRRRGHARVLLSWLIQHARRNAYRRLLLEVGALNQAALQLYHAIGFVQTGCRKRYYSDGEDAVLMELPITPEDR
jgi:ribosomal-protein-alanine N-acetyltransferase